MEACCHPQRDGIRMWTENLKITRIVSKTKENRLLNWVSANMTISCSHRERVAPLASQPVSLNIHGAPLCRSNRKFNRIFRKKYFNFTYVHSVVVGVVRTLAREDICQMY